MKDFIYINYNIFVEKIISNYFFVNDDKILIIKCKDEIKKIDNLVELTNSLYSNKIYVNTFILNSKGEYYTERNSEYIILLKVNDREELVTLDYLNKFNNINSQLDELDLNLKWTSEIDDLETKLTELNKEYNIIQKSFNYYVGLSENAIQLLNNYEKENCNDICHNVKLDDFNIQQLNNPFVLIKQNRMYDIALLVKYYFFNTNFNFDILDEIFTMKMNEYDEVVFFSSLLYADYYFDYISDILNLKKEEDSLNKYINNIKKYEELLNYCQKYLKKSKYIKLINWFNK